MQTQITNENIISLERFNIGDDIVYHTLDNGKAHALLKSQAHWLTTEQGTCPFCRASRKAFQLGQVIEDPDTISL